MATNAHRFFVPIGMIPLDEPPPDPTIGDTYFDVVLGLLRTWDGTAWTVASMGPTGPQGPAGGDSVYEVWIGPTGPTGPSFVLWVNTSV